MTRLMGSDQSYFPVVRNTVLCLVLGVGLLAGTSIAHAQSPMPNRVAQAPVTVPPSGALVTEPPAPVVVPPSGVLVPPANSEGHALGAARVKKTQRLRTVQTAAPTAVRVHHRIATRGVTTRTLARHESILAVRGVERTATAEPIYLVPRYYNFVEPSAARALRARPGTAQGTASVVGTATPVSATAPMPTYRYVYEPDRILVIDPSSNIAVQAIPR